MIVRKAAKIRAKNLVQQDIFRTEVFVPAKKMNFVKNREPMKIIINNSIIKNSSIIYRLKFCAAVRHMFKIHVRKLHHICSIINIMLSKGRKVLSLHCGLNLYGIIFACYICIVAMQLLPFITELAHV